MNTESMNQNQNTDQMPVQGAREKTFTQDDVNRIVQDRLDERTSGRERG